MVERRVNNRTVYKCVMDASGIFKSGQVIWAYSTQENGELSVEI